VTAAAAIRKAAEAAPDESLLHKLGDLLSSIGDRIKDRANDLWHWIQKHADTIYKIGDWLMACRALPQSGFPDTPMLTASVVVPKDGTTPFHPSPSTPLADLEPAPPGQLAHRGHPLRLNARGCLVAVHCGIDGTPSVPLPWQPFHEAPGWWDRLARRCFPEFRQVRVSDWDDVISAVAEPGPDTRAVVWVRREIGGHEASGHLLYAHNHNGQVVFLDGTTGSLGRLDPPALLRELVLLRALPDRSR
jgi:Papain fold toxin 1, glutamine deamidase